MNENVKAPGKTWLKVTGILMVIFSAIAIILLLISLAALGALGVMGGGAVAGVAALGMGALIIGFIAPILEFVGGIIGIAFANKPEKANVCLVFAILMLVMVVINIIAGGFQWTSLIALVLPILYLIGAVKNRGAVA